MIRRVFRLAHGLGLLAFIIVSPLPADQGPVLWYSFDRVEEDRTPDSVDQRHAGRVLGAGRLVPGVQGNAMVFDGQTTRVVCDSGDVPELSSSVSIEAWIAPQTYSWNWAGVVSQGGEVVPLKVDDRTPPIDPYRPLPESERVDRIFFGVDSEGRVGFRLNLEGQIEECQTDRILDLLEWTHLAATFDQENGMRIYVDGRLATSRQVSGRLSAIGDHLTIGMNQRKMAPTRSERAASASLRSPMVFDGLIDELKLYDRSLTPSEISRHHESEGPRISKPLTYRRMPTGPLGNDRFGAYYTYLAYSPEWDRYWRVGAHPDILVKFDQLPTNMMFWHGTAYGAVFAAENEQLMADQSLERSNANKSPWGCSEHMSDKQCRFSSVRIIENSPARIVVHWRYAISDIMYDIFGTNPETGWGEWADEYYTIYPDGVSTRYQILWTDFLSHEWQETIVLHHPGTRPEDNIEIDALTFANMDGETHTYSWSSEPVRKRLKPENATIQRTNLKSDYKPFIIFEPDSGIKLAVGSIPDWSHFPWWNHWPVGRIPNDGRRTAVPDRPAHSSLSQSIEESGAIHYDEERGFHWAVTLIGMTNGETGELSSLAKSWNRPATVTLATTDYVSAGYDRKQRAYVFNRSGQTDDSALRFRVSPGPDSVLLNPAFVVKDWGRGGAGIRLNGMEYEPGTSLRIGHYHRLEGSDLIVWLKLEETGPLEVEIIPDYPEKPSSGTPDRAQVITADDRETVPRLKLPSGPSTPGTFGAYYEHLKYSPEWDQPWRISDHPDVVVRLDQADHRFVFWHGASYIPCWTTPDGPWYSNGSFERNTIQGNVSGRAGPMNDRTTRYSHIRVIENNPARVVIHWRYAPVDRGYVLPYRDPMTGWGDWADEVYTIYPDGTGVRKATLHSSSPPDDWINYQESIIINQPGTVPEDNIHTEGITLANLAGESMTFTWGKDGPPEFDDAPEASCIQLINTYDSFKPFSIVNPLGAAIRPGAGRSQGSEFSWREDWPVPPANSNTATTDSRDRPSNTRLSHFEFPPISNTGLARTWVMLHGMTDRSASDLVSLARSWISPAVLEITGSGLRSLGYDTTQAAYILERTGDLDSVDLILPSNTDQPTVNPAIVIRKFGEGIPDVSLDGKILNVGKDYRIGKVSKIGGDTLVIWMSHESSLPLTITLSVLPGPSGDGS